jgi:hypothetical protein
MDRWRAAIDSDDNYDEFMEQPLLVKALQHQYRDLFYNNGNSPKVLCHVVEFPDQPRHFNMAKTKIVSGPTMSIPTIVQFSARRVIQSDAQEQRNSFVQALQLRYQPIRVNGTINATMVVSIENGSKHLVSRNNTLIPWETVITPMSTKGIGYTNG